MVGGRPVVLSEAANECGWSRRVRSGDAQREARCDAGSECGGESPATEPLSEAGGADCIGAAVCVRRALWCGWSRRVRCGDEQREARCDAGSECGGESPATEALSEAGGADCMWP